MMKITKSDFAGWGVVVVAYMILTVGMAAGYKAGIADHMQYG